MRHSLGSAIAKLLLVAAIAAAAVLTPLATGSSAQEPATPPAWDCTVDSIGLMSILEIVNSLEDAQLSEGLTPIEEAALLPGDPVSEVDQLGIEDTTWQLAACVNAMDPFRFAALFTPTFQARLVLGLLSGEDLSVFAEQVPLIVDHVESNEGLQAIEIVESWYTPMSTHEIEAILAPHIDDTDEQRRFLVRFVFTEDRWQIDELRPIISETGPEAATPVTEEASPVAEPVASPVLADSATIVSYDIYFLPGTITIPADTPVTLTLPNDGAAPHNFSIDELGIDIDLAPGVTEEVIVNAPAGEYEFYCDIPGHRQAGMVGTLIVE